MSDDTDAIPGPLMPFMRGTPQVRFSTETKARCFVLFATMAGRNCAAVERLIQEELAGTDQPVPTRQSIATWARNEQWAEQADDLWRTTKSWSREQLQVLALANLLLGQQRRHEVLLGQYLDRPDVAAQYLKAGELSDRAIERILPLSAMQPPPAPVEDESELSREEREARPGAHRSEAPARECGVEPQQPGAAPVWRESSVRGLMVAAHAQTFLRPLTPLALAPAWHGSLAIGKATSVETSAATP